MMRVLVLSLCVTQLGLGLLVVLYGASAPTEFGIILQIIVMSMGGAMIVAALAMGTMVLTEDWSRF